MFHFVILVRHKMLYIKIEQPKTGLFNDDDMIRLHFEVRIIISLSEISVNISERHVLRSKTNMYYVCL